MNDLVGCLVKTKRTPETLYRPYETAYDRKKTMYAIVLKQSEKGFALVHVLSNKGVPIYKECFYLNELSVIMSKQELLSINKNQKINAFEKIAV